MHSAPVRSAPPKLRSTSGDRHEVFGMTRPGLGLEVDERTPSLLVHHGESFSLENFPMGTRVIYPPDSLPGIRNVRGAIRNALRNPLGQDPLPEQLKAGMKLTVAFDDISLPLPPM